MNSTVIDKALPFSEVIGYYPERTEGAPKFFVDETLLSATGRARPSPGPRYRRVFQSSEDNKVDLSVLLSDTLLYQAPFSMIMPRIHS